MNRRPVLAALALATSLTAPAAAQSVHALDGTHETLSNNFEGRVLFIEYTGGSGATRRATVVRLNDYFGLTAAHVASGIKNGTSPVVGTGTNYLSDPGITRNVIDWGVHPSWPGSFNGTAADLAWVRFDQPLPGPPGFETETIRGTGTGVAFTFIGFGRPATPSLGLQPFDGERRAFTGVVDQQGNAGFGVSTDYSQSDFLTLAQRSMPEAGVATEGNSGSPGFKDLDSSLALLVVANAGAPSYGSSTFSLRLKAYEDWIVANTTPPAPCAPDVNADGVVDNGDIGVFVALFLAGDIAADFNADGLLDNGDIGAFVAAFLAGC